jgi:heme exporter protein D
MMLDLGPHAIFIVWAYAGVAIVTAAIIAWVAWNASSVKRRLAALEAQGVRRRSDVAKT